MLGGYVALAVNVKSLPTLDKNAGRVRIEMKSQQGANLCRSKSHSHESIPHYSPESCNDCPNKIVCRLVCLQVTEEQVIRMITRLELQTVHDVRSITGAGDGCTCCHAKLEEYLEIHGTAAAVAG